ncbi:DeoR/GlpR family DNA-binding transcription regulator [Ornithinimicrobium sp. Y1847]|uniref:DeoR/GlpR family DNA-binding transcription regulator n=1 Tax=Ornithinimicrobium sp. Y1847 TaxID=3405419 RepID=UPI003B686133
MARAGRLAELLERVVSDGSVSVEDVMETYGVSASTARRDLDVLAEQQLVTRTRGGAMANRGTGDVPMRYRSGRQEGEKQAIARAAVERLEVGTVVAFNGGTTTTTVAYELGVAMAAAYPHEEDVITVVTNAVNIANDLAVRNQLRVVVTGGVARARSYELVGPLAEALLPRISIDTLVLGVNAIDLDGDGGLFTHHDGEAMVNAALVQSARRTIVVADSSKVGGHAFARICGLGDVEVLITDTVIQVPDAEQLTAAGIEVVTASSLA